MKETKLTQLLSKLSGSKGVAVLICFVAFMFVGFVSAEAQTATIDAQTGLITLDDQQAFPVNGEFTMDVAELNFSSLGEASTYFAHYNQSQFFTVAPVSLTEARVTVHYQLPADTPLPYSYWNVELEDVNTEHIKVN